VKTAIRSLKQIVRLNDGATMIEYALLASLVSIAAIAALRALGPALLGLYFQVAAAVGAA
jgi:pilus assembly protein Flp/PilA